MRRMAGQIGFCSGAVRTLSLCATLLAIGCGLTGNVLFPPDTITTVQYYAVPFVCMTDETGGVLIQSTSVTVHNPEADPIDVFRRAAQSDLESNPPPEVSVWNFLRLTPDQAVRLDCDSIIRTLLDDATATLAGSFPAGTPVEGFYTLAIEAAGESPRIDVSVDYGGDGLDVALVIPSLVVVEEWPPFEPPPAQ